MPKDSDIGKRLSAVIVFTLAETTRPVVNADRSRNQSREKDFTENSNTENVVGL